MSTRTINGVNYDLQGTNWQKEIDDAVNRGDYASAAQFEQARNEKITSNNYNGTQATTNNYSQYLNSGSSATKPTSGGSSNTTVKTNTGVNGGYDTGVYGSAILQDNPYQYSPTYANGSAVSAVKGPDTTRRTDLAGKTAVSNGYTVYYDDMGYATKAVKGVTDYLERKDPYVSSGNYSGGNLWTDEEMLSAADLAAINNYRNQISAGTLTADEANRLANAIRANYGYTINKDGVVSDSGFGTTVYQNRVKQGLEVNGLTSAEQKYLELMFPEQNADSAYDLLGAYSALQNGTYNPKLSYTNGAVSQLGQATGLNMGGYNSMTEYLKDMYSKNLEAELSALKSAYDSNVAELESQNEKIAEEYRAARNQTAAQNQMEMQSMNERALATGLNTGTSGQLALAQSMAYQNNLGNLYAQQNRDNAENERAMAALLRDYNAGVNQATATSNAQLAQALYNEMIRQEELAAAQAAAQLEAERYQREWDYKVEQDKLDRQLAYAKLYDGSGGGKTPSAPGDDLTYSQAMDSVSDSTQLGAVAKNLYDHYVTTGGGLTSARKGDLAAAYNNGQITNDELNYILNVLGV